MPFTLAHPVAIMPFLKSRYVSATALIAGSVAPDFEYFFRMQSGGTHGHTLWGVLYFDLPVGVALAWIFHSVIKHGLVANLPGFLQRRFQPVLTVDIKRTFRTNGWVFVSSVAIGALSHILWDSFTHGDGYIVRRVAYLADTRIVLDGARYPLWYALQHTCSVAGLLVLGVYIWIMDAPSTPVRNPSLVYWTGIVGITALVFYLRFVWGPYMNEGNTVVALMAAGLLAVTVVSGLFSRMQRSASTS